MAGHVEHVHEGAVPGQGKTAIAADTPAERETVYIPPLAYLRSVWAMLWTAIRYPRQTTYVDLSTGRYVTLPR
jgi:hypothetical protein